MSASFDRPMTMTGFSSLCCEPSTMTVAGSASIPSSSAETASVSDGAAR